MPKRPAQRDIHDLADRRSARYLRVSRADAEDRRKDTFDAERSTSTQRRIYEQWAERSGVRTADEYADPDISASRFADEKERPEFNRMVADVKAGKLDVLWFWTLSRQQRKLRVFAELRDLCRDMGVIWVIRDRVYDPADTQDMLQLGIQSMFDEKFSEDLSKAVFDGKESAAMQGRPAGRIQYGYKRIYDPHTKAFIRDEPDVWDGNGRPVEDSPAAVVREIFDRIHGGEPVNRIRKDLDERQIPTKYGSRWWNSSILQIAQNPVYAGLRVYHGKILDGVQAQAEPLVDLGIFWDVQDILTDPKRKTTRPGTGKHLLSSIATCGQCGSKLVHRNQWRGSERSKNGDLYVCWHRACVAIYEPLLDRFAAERVIRWLSNPETAREITRRGDSPAARAARTDRIKEEAKISEWRKLAEHGDIDAVDFAAFKKGALARIADAKRRETESSVPAIVTRFLGGQAQAGWDAADITIRRQLVQAVAEVRVHSVGRDAGARAEGPVNPVYRVAWRWKLDGAGDWIPPLSWEDAKAARAAVRAELHQRRDYASKERTDMITDLLRTAPELADREIARRAGCVDRHAIRRIRRELEGCGDIPTIRRNGRARYNRDLGPLPELPGGIAKDKRGKISEALREPGASHVRVARLFGVSTSTVGTVCAETNAGCPHGRRSTT